MANDQKHDHVHGPGRSIAARFASGAEARQAVAALHKAKYTHTWIGTTSIAVGSGGNETVTVESGGGFFSQTHSLVDALVSHGVLGDTAREIERTINAGDALVTVDPKDRDETEAIALLEQHGGDIAGHAAGSSAGFWLAPSQSRILTPAGYDANAYYGEEDTFSRR